MAVSVWLHQGNLRKKWKQILLCQNQVEVKYKTFCDILHNFLYFVSFRSYFFRRVKYSHILSCVTVELNFALQPGEGAYISRMFEHNWLIVVFSDQL